MKKLVTKLISAGALVLLSLSANAQNQYDPVCGMKVTTSESFNCKYKGIKYYFDSYDCKEEFKRDPETFLSKNAPR